eukprot:jgi/Botrbrau1/20791/Bobra.0156s0021.1
MLDLRSVLCKLNDQIATSDDDCAALLERSLVLGNLGRWQDSAADAYRALSLEPHSTEAHYRAFVALLKQNQVQGALDHLRQALDRDPHHPKLQKYLGLFDGHKGSSKEHLASSSRDTVHLQQQASEAHAGHPVTPCEPRDVATWRMCMELLNLPWNATSKDIRAAYLREVITAHPDKGGSRELFERIQNAFNYLMANGTMFNQATTDNVGNVMEPLHRGQEAVFHPAVIESSCQQSFGSEDDFAEQHADTAYAALQAGESAVMAGVHL